MEAAVRISSSSPQRGQTDQTTRARSKGQARQARYWTLNAAQRKLVRRADAEAAWAEHAARKRHAAIEATETEDQRILRERVEAQVALTYNMALPEYRIWRDTSKDKAARKAQAAERELRARFKPSREQLQQQRTALIEQALAHKAERELLSKEPDAIEMTRRTRCLRPYKIAYIADEVGQAAAQLHVDELRTDGFGKDLSIYRCRCGWLHVGNDSRAFERRVRTSVRR